jgi:hypothetical protein
MASFIGWIVVGLVGIGTLVGVLGIAVSSVMLAVRKLGELFGRRHPAPEVTSESAPERTAAHAA